MRYILFKIGSIPLYSYGFMIAIGVLLAFVVSEKRAARYGLDKDQVFNLGLWAAIGGFLGAKILFFITELPAIIKDPTLLKSLSSGFVVYGGIIGGVLTAWIYCRIKHLEFLKYFDLILPAVALAQGFGRIGCFLAGCCYGRETESWFHVTFTDSPYAPNGVPLIPTQLISAAGDFVLFAILLLAAKKLKKAGQVGGVYMILYSIGRFGVECLRADDRGNVGMLSTSQFIAIFLLIIGVAFVLAPRKIKAANEEKNKNI